MSLYRACFLKRGKMKGQTFSATSAAAADRYATTVIEPLFGVTVLTVKPLSVPKQQVLPLNAEAV